MGLPYLKPCRTQLSLALHLRTIGRQERRLALHFLAYWRNLVDAVDLKFTPNGCRFESDICHCRRGGIGIRAGFRNRSFGLRVRVPPTTCMGKRTNPIGLRTNYTNIWKTDCLGPSYSRQLRLSLFPAVHACLSDLLAAKKISLLWFHAKDLGFAADIDVFCSDTPTIYDKIFIHWRLHVLFKSRLRVRYHSLSKWLVVSNDRKNTVVSALGRYRRFRENRFFFRTAGLLRLGFSALNSELLSRVVRDIMKKHNRHWLVFRFLKNTLDLFVESSSSIAGLRLLISGKLNGRPRKKKKEFRFGIMPLQAFSHDIDYSYRVVVTKFGVFGIKLWLFRRHTKKNDKLY